MGRDILSEYGPDKDIVMQPRAKRGGEPERDVMSYKPPMGPTNIGDAKGPGLHGDNCGNSGSQGYYEDRDKETSGSPGLHGDNKGTSGSQGRR